MTSTVPRAAAPAEAITPHAWRVLAVTSLEIHYLPDLSRSPPRLLQGEREDCRRLDGRYRFAGRGGVVAVGPTCSPGGPAGGGAGLAVLGRTGCSPS